MMDMMGACVGVLSHVYVPLGSDQQKSGCVTYCVLLVSTTGSRPAKEWVCHILCSISEYHWVQTSKRVGVSRVLCSISEYHWVQTST